MTIAAPVAGLRVAVDLVCVADVADSLRRLGDRYTSRVYSAAELTTCGNDDDRASRLAVCFAAKEAALKLLRGSAAPDWRTIELLVDTDGGPLLRLSGDARVLADAACLHRILISVGCSGGLAIATAVGESGGGRAAGLASAGASGERVAVGAVS